MKTIARLIPGIAALLAGCAFAPPDLRHDHTNPVSLNEYAMQKAREGDFATAAVLLERAVLLAPHDTRIVRNRDTLRAGRDGIPPLATRPVDATEPADAPAAAAESVLPPYPLWQMK